MQFLEPSIVFTWWSVGLWGWLTPLVFIIYAISKIIIFFVEWRTKICTSISGEYTNMGWNFRDFWSSSWNSKKFSIWRNIQTSSSFKCMSFLNLRKDFDSVIYLYYAKLVQIRNLYIYSIHFFYFRHADNCFVTTKDVV